MTKFTSQLIEIMPVFYFIFSLQHFSLFLIRAYLIATLGSLACLLSLFYVRSFTRLAHHTIHCVHERRKKHTHSHTIFFFFFSI